MSPELFIPWLADLHQYLVSIRHRGIIIFEGDHAWAMNTVLASIANRETLKVGGKIFSEQTITLPNTSTHHFNVGVVNSKTFRHHLGTENHFVFYADSKLNIDALAVMSGTIVSGGLLFIWQKNIEEDVSLSPFYRRFNACLDNVNIEQIYRIKQTSTTLPVINKHRSPVDAQNMMTSQLTGSLCKTIEQQQAVIAIKKVVKGRRNRPLVLTADRGRGKSTALAIACGELIKENVQPLYFVITASNIMSLEIFFTQLKRVIKLSSPSLFEQGAKLSLHKNIISFGRHKIEFLPIDIILMDKPKVSALFIDEAASFPVYLLEKLLTHYHRLVFSSTVHGYEGAGRGFAIKFQQLIKQYFPNWQALHIEQAIRWGHDDPLERFIFNACLLDATLPELKKLQSLNDSINDFKTGLSSDEFSQWRDQAELISVSSNEFLQNEALLAEVFAILVTAHYQTKPSDLMMLLDNPQMKVFCLIYQQQVMAVSLVIEEGKLAQEDVQNILTAKKRIKNQFIPQSLIVHCGQVNAAQYRYWRIMRIAVHPSLQSKGLGTKCLEQIAILAKENKVDMLATSFAANAKLSHFWLKSGYIIARLGFTADASSGEHSAVFIKSLNEQSNTLQANLQKEFYRTFDYYLYEEYQTLSLSLISLILEHCPEHLLPELTEQDHYNIQAYANGHQLFSCSVYSLHMWLRHQLVRPQLLSFEFMPLISRIMMKYPTEIVCQQSGLTGRKALQDYMRKIVLKNITQK